MNPKVVLVIVLVVLAVIGIVAVASSTGGGDRPTPAKQTKSVLEMSDSEVRAHREEIGREMRRAEAMGEAEDRKKKEQNEVLEGILEDIKNAPTPKTK